MLVHVFTVCLRRNGWLVIFLIKGKGKEGRENLLPLAFATEFLDVLHTTRPQTNELPLGILRSLTNWFGDRLNSP